MPRSAVLVVLGDLARSTRMLAHAHALVREGWEVDLVGDLDTELPEYFRRRREVGIHPLPAAPDLGPGVVEAFVRLQARSRGLTRTLREIRRVPSAVLLQSPPGLPALGPVIEAARGWGARTVVDWHNLGWELVRMRGGVSGVLAPVLRAREIRLAAAADAHLGVSVRLAGALVAEGLTEVQVLEDGPPGFHDWDAELGPASRPTLLCPMSWSVDDDLQLLHSALGLLNADPTPAPSKVAMPRLVLSGIGPMRDRWADRLTSAAPPGLEVEVVFVPSDRYPALVGSAEVGLSLHASASGLDYPMKIVEMRRAGLPVFALDYGDALRARFRVPRDGRLFRTSEELAELIRRYLLTPAAAEERGQLRDGLGPSPDEDWQIEWRKVCLPLLTG